MGIFSKKTKDKAADKNQQSALAASGQSPAREKPRASSASFKILLRPLISEKSTRGVALGQYAFAVDIRANKVEIKKAIEDIYGVQPRSVNIINERRRRRRFGRFQGQTKRVKKAIVTLPQGQTIKLYEGI